VSKSDLAEPASCTNTESSQRRRFFPQATDEQWSDWKWHLRNRIRSFSRLSQLLQLSEEEKLAADGSGLPVSITPYYASLMDPTDSMDPIRRCMVPVINETFKAPEESEDPLCEAEQSPLPTLVHRYPDRVLFLTTNLCSSYCRYCTRSRTVGQKTETGLYTRSAWTENLQYIRDHREIRDVLLSGGDPLMLSTETLEWLLAELRDIPHVEMVRIGTKIPIVLPQRVTEELTSMLKKYHPLFMSIHCTHPREVTPESSQALNKLADAGIPLGSQTVLLAGINDEAEILKQLFHRLLRCRVKPYYMYSCDRIIGSSHFVVPVQKGRDLIKALRGHTSGYAIPTYVIDAPGGGGKIPVGPNYIESIDENRVVMKNYEDDLYVYQQ